MEPFSTIPTVSIFGVPFSKLDLRETVELLASAVEERRICHVITGNPIMLMGALDDPAYMRMMKRAELIVPDGTGVVWAAGRIGDPVKERVAGFDLMERLCSVGEERGWRVFLLGASPEVIAVAREQLLRKFPSLRIVGIHDGFFGEERDLEVIAQIKQASPDLLFVGRSAATQEPWIDRYKQQLGVPVVMGVGGSFDVISGKLKRAPEIFQKMRLEWFYRLLREPWRYKRMLALPKFAAKVMREHDNMQ